MARAAWPARAAELVDVNIVYTDGSASRSFAELMKQQGWFEEFGLRPNTKFILGNQGLMDALTSGAADVCMASGVSQILAAIEGGAPLRLIAGANQLPVQALFSTKPDVRTMKDLEGRRVGVGPKGALLHQLVFAAMRKQGADPAMVQFVDLGNSGSVFRATARGEVDAGVGEADVFDQQAKYGVHVIQHGVFWEELSNYPNQGSYATVAAIRDKRDLLVRVLAVHAKLYRFIHRPESKDAYARARAAGLPNSDPAEAQTQWNFYQRLKPFAENLALSEEKTLYIQELNVAMGLQKAILPASSVIDNSLAAEAVARLR